MAIVRRFGVDQLARGCGAIVIALGARGCVGHESIASEDAGPVSSATPLAASTAPPAAESGEEPHFVDELDVRVFQKGNLHAHSSRSDGDSSPKDVFGWYWRHGYQFIAITDHHGLTAPMRPRPGFIAIPGEEVTMNVAGRPVHVNALCIKNRIPGHHFPEVAPALRWAVDAVLAQGGIALLNHPNYEWALRWDDLRAGHGAQLLEIWSGHPAVHPDGDTTHPSGEAIWDMLLGAGETFAGVAVDDTHALKRSTPEPAARGGRGWVQVFAAETTASAICDALGKGRLYASNGAALKRLAVSRDDFTVWPQGDNALVEFIGYGGRLLTRVDHVSADDGATYHPTGAERYVRARITAPDGTRAWTQAYRVAR